MASTSASSIQKSFKYDVFLSFRGEDTRKNFVDHLYKALEQHGIETYKDDEKIRKGKTISDELIEAIEDSRFYIIVFSKNYASSCWCLEELVKIMECEKMTEHTAYPVFYDVEPTEVRKLYGPVGEAFKKHEKEEAAGKWREALKEAAALAGWELKTTADGHEANFIQKIIHEISLELRFINSSVDGNLVGMETRVNEVISFLEMGVDDVRMIGIKGMGGAGKTTLARAVFDKISFQFEGQSFVENVREESKPSLSGLKSLQKQVLSDVLNDPKITVSGVHEGKKMIQKKMHVRKVLIVLDDVDKIEQLEALVGDRDWFKPGSRIIITTRDEQVLVAHKVGLIQNVNLLSSEEAICLFSRYAFGKEVPVPGYEELSGLVVCYAAGLPLTIKVLGSFLCGKDDLDWKDALERLETIPLNETMKVLELSYIGLEEDYKEIFLDVACILKGWRKDDAVIALKSCGFPARIGLRVLELKSLITISEDGALDMHDHIEEMGRNIVRRLNPNEPECHSRLWIHDEINDILANNMGTQAIKCITLDANGLNFEILMEGLTNMKKLRFLDLDTSFVSKVDYYDSNLNTDEVSLYLPNALRFLRFNGYPFSCLPKTFQAKNLVGLELRNTNIVQLWDDGEQKVFLKLRFLKLAYSKLRTIDLNLAPNLETLRIKKCTDMVKLHIPTECPKLVNLELSNLKLTTLHLGITPNLETLRIKKCTDMVELQIPAECPKLVTLDLDNLKLTTLHLGITPNLEKLSVNWCTDMVELRMPAECPMLKKLDLSNLKLRTLHLGIPPNLETLSLRNCTDMVELRMPAECPKLVIFDLYDLKLRTLHLGITPNLEILTLAACTDMVELHITAECPKLGTLVLNENAKLRTLDLGLTPNLQWLYLRNCYDLEGINAPAECLEKLLDLVISHCGRFKSFEFDKELDSPEVVSLSELHLIADDTGICDPGNTWPEFQFSCYYKGDPASSFGNLERLISLGFGARIYVDSFSDIICGLQCLRKLTLEGGIPEAPKNLDWLDCLEELNLRSTNIKTLPDSICMLKHLKYIEIEFCYDFDKLPEDIGRLECLEELRLISTKITNIPDSICMLKHLKSLEIKYCYYLHKLPEDIGRLECLENLTLKECLLLRDIPSSICELKSLKSLDLNSCVLVGKIPEEIGCLKCLKELNIKYTEISCLPQSIFGLKGLRIVGDTLLLKSYGFTPKIRRFSDKKDETYCYIEP